MSPWACVLVYLGNGHGLTITYSYLGELLLAISQKIPICEAGLLKICV